SPAFRPGEALPFGRPRRACLPAGVWACQLPAAPSSLGSVAAMTAQDTMPKPPAAKRVPKVREYHGDRVVDEVAWLANPDDPDTDAYLGGGNAFTRERMKGQGSLRETICSEFKTRTQETDLSLPVRTVGYWYYTRTV